MSSDLSVCGRGVKAEGENPKVVSPVRSAAMPPAVPSAGRPDKKDARLRRQRASPEEASAAPTSAAAS